ncbi:hypothetical protein SNOG_08533 [Parastagonospora nodorum SN15]|uniref:Uncharacterized protein n=1 Tax=Phaeosphaeria nodorum (strain SN15 / ATCC MYA-4574 / FGSC 10173) TaxID=321614 RepID=Q0UI81_PHANO|nr:hypothetical protein SNOG_08533 [Parastagonospora nodorum SN15]EAT83701.1 hypothetical protein SNOG_08533 [Parastagonospora nodorum SN15]
MRNTHVPTSVPSAPNHSFVSTRYTNVNAPRSPPVVHTSKSNAAWLTYPNTPARIIPQQHATACSGFYLGLSDNGRDRVGSGLGPTGGWCFGKGVQGQLGGMSAGVRAEEWKNELFNEALSSAGSLDAEKAVELRQKWERESGSLEQGH